MSIIKVIKAWAQPLVIAVLVYAVITGMVIIYGIYKGDPSTYQIKCADTNGNITVDTKVEAYDFVADDLTFKFDRADGKRWVVSGFCVIEEQ